MAQFSQFLQSMIKTSCLMHSLHYISGKPSNEFEHIWESYGQKTTQEQPKIILSAGTKTFEI